jgi:hypothetical protein
MGIFGLSNNMTNFLGGVAEGVERQIEKDQAYTNDLVKDTSGIVIKARLDSKERRQSTIGEYSKDISQLVALGYGKQESAAIISQGRKADFVKLAQTTPRDKLNTLYKVTSTYEGDTPLSITDLAEAIEGPYKQPTVDLSGVPKRKTFLSAIGLDSDIDTQIKQRVGTLTPDSTSSDVDFDKLTQLLSGDTTAFGREKLRKDTGSLSATSVEGKLRTYITEKLGGTVSYINNQPVYNLDQRDARIRSTELTANFLDKWRDLVSGDNAINKEKALKQIIDRIKEDSSITSFNKLDDGGDGKDKEIIDPAKIIKKKDDKKPVIEVIKNDPAIINKIAKESFTSENSIKYNSLGAKDKAIYKRDLIKRFVKEGGMTRVDAENVVKENLK